MTFIDVADELLFERVLDRVGVRAGTRMGLLTILKKVKQKDKEGNDMAHKAAGTGIEAQEGKPSPMRAALEIESYARIR